jgi:hypothetical protein
MTLNESIVEDAALEWFGELGYAVGHGPHLAPGEPAAERDSFSEVEQAARKASRKCQGTTKIKRISIWLPITEKLLNFHSLVVARAKP